RSCPPPSLRTEGGRRAMLMSAIFRFRSLSAEAVSISFENTQPFPSQKIPMPSEPLAMYNRRSTYLIQVRETRAPLATFPRVLAAVSNTLPPELRSDPNAFEKGDRPSIAAFSVFPHGNLCTISIAQQFMNHLGVR